MSPSAALNADKPENSSAVVRIVTRMATVNGRGKCMTLFAPLVAKRRRCLSSPEKGDLCTAVTVTLKSGARLALRKGNTKRGGHCLSLLSLLLAIFSRFYYTSRQNGATHPVCLNGTDLSNPGVYSRRVVFYLAAKTASIIFTYPVQRQRLPSSPSFTSSSVGLGFSSSNAFATIIIPGVQ